MTTLILISLATIVAGILGAELGSFIHERARIRRARKLSARYAAMWQRHDAIGDDAPDVARWTHVRSLPCLRNGRSQ